MDLQLRCIATHPRGSQPGTATAFAFSTRHPRLVTAASDILIDQRTSSNALRAVIRLSAPITRLVYVGPAATFLAFLDSGVVAAFVEHASALLFAGERRLAGDGRSVALAEGGGGEGGRFAIFAKAESPSLWCLPVAEEGGTSEPFKLRSDIEGEQESVNLVGGAVARVRGKIATNVKTRTCPVVAIAAHASLQLVAAAYTNGIVRVWDVRRKEQRSHFDAQLMMGEGVVDVAMHPVLPVLVLCTTQGRVFSFSVKSGLFRRGEEAAMAASKTKDRKRRFLAMCFMPGSPSYLMLLTTSRRIVVRIIDKSHMIVNSARFPKSSKPLAINENAVLATTQAADLEDAPDADPSDGRYGALLCEPAFGLLAAAFDNTGNVYVFQTRACGIPAIRRPITCGLDTGFSHLEEDSSNGPVMIDADTLVVQRNVLFSYELGKEEAKMLCVLPPGDVQKMEVARDAYGYCIAALVFYLGDEPVDPSQGYVDADPPARYVLCTRRGDAETWTASEPSDGLAGCFLNAPGRHNRILILASSGKMTSLLSFAGSPDQTGVLPVRQSRGVQRFRLEGKVASNVFRTPFASWCAILYHEQEEKRICVSRNAFDRDDGLQSLESQMNLEESYDMDEGTALPLRDKEVVMDVRWQLLPSGSRREQYIGAIMTDQRIYFVKDVLEPISVFEFHRVGRMVVPFAPPSCCWVGPNVMVLFGDSLISVTLDGRSDLIAGLSHGENVTALLAALPDRVIYAKPSPKHALNSVSIASRPYSAMSGLVRGMLSLPAPRGRRASHQIDKVRSILENQDVSQGSIELVKALIGHGLAPIAYLLAVSEQGRHSMPPLRRADFLGYMGDIRGALAIAESEYSRLCSADEFHEGTELYRLLQKILNMAFASNDFTAGRRCSALLGRKGTFSAFVDMEGGYVAVTSIAEYARSKGNGQVAKLLKPLIARSGKSSVATDSSVIPSRRELDNIRRAIQSVDMSSIPLGSRDRCETFRKVAPGEDADGNPVPASQVQLETVSPRQIRERLELYRTEVTVDLKEMESMRLQGMEEGTEDLNMSFQTAGDDVGDRIEVPPPAPDSSDEEDIFETRPVEAVTPKLPDLPEPVQQQADVLRQRLQEQKQASLSVLQNGREESSLFTGGRNPGEPPGRAVPAVRAGEMLARGFRKLEEERLTSAQKDFESALRTIRKGREQGHTSPIELIRELVYYKLMTNMRVAMEEIRTGAHANTLAGRVTYTQLATWLAALPLRPQHRLEALVMVTDANIVMGNFGTAAQAMQVIKDVGVANDAMRASLRDKYAACSARGFANMQALPVQRVCFQTLHAIPPGVRVLACNVCPAVFSGEAGLSGGGECLSCGLGSVSIR